MSKRRRAEKNRNVSAIGPKQTSLAALHMSACGGKADMTICGLLRSLLGVKRTSVFAAHMSAYDPKRTSIDPFQYVNLTGYDGLS
jgi:hypothetical protein